MNQEETIDQFLERAEKDFLAHISLDCVVFGFHAGQLKVLLLKVKHADQRALPGGFVMKQETMEEAAIRTLRERTGVENVFLQQFAVFSDPGRGWDAEGRKKQSGSLNGLSASGFMPLSNFPVWSRGRMRCRKRVTGITSTSAGRWSWTMTRS
jgi:hypothetical protein